MICVAAEIAIAVMITAVTITVMIATLRSGFVAIPVKGSAYCN